MKNIPLYVKILAGMVAGILLGFAALWSGGEKIAGDWVAPWGVVFIRMLKLVAVPLVFLSLVKGIANLHDIRRLSRMGLRSLGIYVATTVFAIMIGLSAVYLIGPGNVFSDSEKVEYREMYGGPVEADNMLDGDAVADEAGPLDFLLDIVPDNIFMAFGDNSRMLQIIFIAILMGVAIASLPRDKTAGVVSVIDGLNEVTLRLISYFMLFAPVGVLALMTDLVVNFAGDGSIFAALGMYMLTVVAGLAFIAGVFYPLLIKLFTRVELPRYFKSLFPVQLLAFSTSSSAATLPLTMQQTQRGLGVSHDVASFVLPVGVTINMDGTSCYQAVAVIFIAQIMGLEFSFAQLLTIVLMTTLASIGTPGVPGGSVVMMMMVLGSVGIPAEWLALILGVDRPLDMLRTVVNVTGDTAVACIVDRSEQKRAVNG